MVPILNCEWRLRQALRLVQKSNRAHICALVALSAGADALTNFIGRHFCGIFGVHRKHYPSSVETESVSRQCAGISKCGELLQ